MTVTPEEIAKIVALQLGRRRVSPKDHIVEDLGAESLDVVNIIASQEDRFQIEIPEEEVVELHTITDLFDRVCRGIADNTP